MITGIRQVNQNVPESHYKFIVYHHKNYIIESKIIVKCESTDLIFIFLRFTYENITLFDHYS